LESGYQPEDRAIAYQGYRAAQAGFEDLAQGTRPELIAAAQAEVHYWESQLSLTKEGPRIEDIEAGKAALAQTQAEIQALKVQLSKSQLITPVAGVVTARPFESGETVAAGPAVFTVTELEKPWVAVFVPETEIGQVKLGDLCTVTVDSLPNEPLEGRVTWVSAHAEFTPRFIQTERQRVDLVFRVKVEVDNPGLKLKPGMPADVKIRSSETHV
jgi:HlyD family secretion protein